MTKFFLLIVLLSLSGCSDENNQALFNSNKDTFIKSAHYFSSAWPKTFWQEFEEDDVDAELKQIKADGFNTIVLTVPWRGFEVGFDKNQTQSNEKLYERLVFLIKSIIDNDLLYILRLGFPHDYTPNTGTDGMEQCVGIYTDPKVQKHWANYLNKVFEKIKPFHKASAGIIVSWEDFWCPHFVFPNLSPEKRLEMGQKMGYGEWLKTKDHDIVKVLLQSNDIKFDQVAVPKPANLSYVLYLQFIDKMLDEKVLQPTQSTFPNAALEIRVDKLPIKQGEQYTWIGHDLYLQEKNHRGTYWAPFWGAENKGELLSAEQALKNFKYFLKVVTDQGKNTNHVIEQFNFYDNTPYFPNNANIKPEDIGNFLIQSGPMLAEYSQGFGVWTYRDYKDNGLYNASFEMGLDGWDVNGKVNVVTVSEDQQLHMEKGAEIGLSLLAADRFMLAGSYQSLNLCLESNTVSELLIQIDDTLSHNWPLTEGENCTQITAEPFKKNTPTSITITALKAAEIDEINLNGFTQKLGLYDADGNPGPNLEAYRKLNAAFE